MAGEGHSGGGGSGNSGGSGGNSRNKNRNRNRNRNRSRGKKTGGGQGAAKQPPKAEHKIVARTLAPRKFGVIFFDTFALAKKDPDNLTKLKAEVDQLNIVINEEGDMDDAELSEFGKVFAGEAWTLIHNRRVEAGWYEVAQPIDTVIDFVNKPLEEEAEAPT